MGNQHEWPEVYLGDLVPDIQPGFARRPSSSGRDVAQLRTNNISPDGILDMTDLKHVPATKTEIRKYDLKEGDVLFNNTNSDLWVGKTAFVGRNLEALYSNHLTRLRVDASKIDPRFLALYLQKLQRDGFFRWISTHWVNQTAVNATALRKVRLRIPPIAHQLRIVSIAERMYTVKQIREEASRLAQQIAQSLFLKTFGDPVTNPLGWKLTTVGDHSKIRYGTSQPPSYEKSGIPFIRATDIKMGRIARPEMKFISPESASKIAKCRLDEGNLIIVRSGANTGDCAYVPEEYDGAYAAYDLVLEFDDKLDGRFIWALLNMGYGRRIMKPMTLRAAQPHLNAAQVSSIKVPLPPVERQQTFVSFMARLDGLLRKQAKSTGEINELFHSLMHKALRGELRIAS